MAGTGTGLCFFNLQYFLCIKYISSVCFGYTCGARCTLKYLEVDIYWVETFRIMHSSTHHAFPEMNLSVIAGI